MPSRKQQNLANKLLLDAIIGNPAKIKGKRQRKRPHSKEDAKLLALIGGKKAGKAALVHYFLDEKIPSIVQHNAKFFKLDYNNILNLLKK